MCLLLYTTGCPFEAEGSSFNLGSGQYCQCPYILYQILTFFLQLRCNNGCALMQCTSTFNPSENPEGRDRLRYVEIGPRRWHLPRSAQINIKYSRNIVNWNLIKIICHFYNFLTSRSEPTFLIILLSCFSTSSMVDLAQSLACASEDGHVTGLTPLISAPILLPSPLSLPPLCLHHEQLTPRITSLRVPPSEYSLSSAMTWTSHFSAPFALIQPRTRTYIYCFRCNVCPLKLLILIWYLNHNRTFSPHNVCTLIVQGD